MASVGPTHPPGWYTDPQSPAQVRFWDGTGWTGRTSPAAVPSTQAPGGRGWGRARPAAARRTDHEHVPAAARGESGRRPGARIGQLRADRQGMINEYQRAT